MSPRIWDFAAVSHFVLTLRLQQHDDQFGKAHLQWRLEEVRVLRYGTIEHLVRSLASDTGDLDSSYVNTFLATYRAFTTTPVVLDLLLKW
jgi:ral guanine nucleotide dissociation stimulator-like 1